MSASRGTITWMSKDEGVGFVRDESDHQRYRFHIKPPPGAPAGAVAGTLHRGMLVTYTLDSDGEAHGLVPAQAGAPAAAAPAVAPAEVVAASAAAPPSAPMPGGTTTAPSANEAVAKARDMSQTSALLAAVANPGTQKILSPGAPGTASPNPTPMADTPGAVPSTLWPSVRKFGYLPDVSTLRAGDVLLLSAIVPVNDWLSWRMIQLTRATQIYRGYTEEHARWHHAVIYVGDYCVCEADVHKGVRYGSIFPFIGRHMIRARRVREAQRHPRIGYEIALKAMTSIGRKYAMRTVMEMGWHAFLWSWRQQRFDLELRGDKEVHCSQLFANAYADAGFGNVWRKPREPVFPAELSATDKLVDVDLRWTPVESGRPVVPDLKPEATRVADAEADAYTGT